MSSVFAPPNEKPPAAGLSPVFGAPKLKPGFSSFFSAGAPKLKAGFGAAEAFAVKPAPNAGVADDVEAPPKLKPVVGFDSDPPNEKAGFAASPSF